MTLTCNKCGKSREAISTTGNIYRYPDCDCKKEFNLSEHAIQVCCPACPPNCNHTGKEFNFSGEKVKEFIQLLKEEDNDFYDREIRDQDLDREEIVEVCFKFFNERIKKLSGDKLK